MPTRTNESTIAEILELHGQGLRDGEIAVRLGTSKSNVQRHLEGNRVIRKRRKSDRTEITDAVLTQILPLHVEGKSDQEIATMLDIGKSTVSGFLAGKRTINHKPTRQLTDDGLIICSICREPKASGEFGNPRFNGKALSKPSFCKSCQQEKTAKRLADPQTYIRKRVNDLAARARRKGTPFALTFEVVWEIHTRQRGKCFYTDAQMALFGEDNLRQSLSFDRVVPELGYIEGNVVLCTYKANAVKQDLTLEELQCWLPGWYARLGSCEWLNLGGSSVTQ